MTDYAVQIIRCIHESEKEIVTSKEIAEKEGISHGVLMKVLRILRLNGFLISHQGRGEVAGGYSLNRSIRDMTLLDIIECMEGTVTIAEPLDEDEQSQLSKGSTQILKEYQRVSTLLRKELGRYSILELLEENK